MTNPAVNELYDHYAAMMASCFNVMDKLDELKLKRLVDALQGSPVSLETVAVQQGLINYGDDISDLEVQVDAHLDRCDNCDAWERQGSLHLLQGQSICTRCKNHLDL